jgi:hypothetical protein
VCFCSHAITYLIRAALATLVAGKSAKIDTSYTIGSTYVQMRPYAEAEPLPLAGYEGRKQREAQIPAQGKVPLTEALERLVQLDDAWGKPDEAAKWRQELAAQKAAAKPPGH